MAEVLTGASLAVWTTTAWTIPANLAVAVNDRLRYTLVEAQVRDDLKVLDDKAHFPLDAEAFPHVVSNPIQSGPVLRR
jgi:isoleucyl-tRNA synthetase